MENPSLNMKKYILSLIMLVLVTKGFAQTGVMDNFDDNVLDPNWKFLLSCPAPAAPCYTGTESNSELQVVTTAVGPAYENFEFQFPAINVTANPVVKINVKNSVAFNMRIDLTDINGYATNASPTVVAIPVSASYVQYTFNFAGKFSQTTPTAQTVDQTKIVKAVIFINPGGTAMSTTVFINDLIVSTPPAPTAGFTASSATVCTGAPVTFTNTSSNGITSYAWNFGTGATPATATTYGPHNVTWSSAGTKTITLTVTGPGGSSTAPAGTVTVNAPPGSAGTITGSTGVCNGSSATYSVAAVSGATGYAWTLPAGASITSGTNTNNVTVTFGTTSGNVSVAGTNANGCGNGTASPNLAVTISPIVAASVTITASATSICSGNSVTFTAAPVNGGASPTYQWKVNGANVGSASTSNTFTSTTLANGNVVTVAMTSNAVCVTGSPATSNGITMTVSSGGAPTISVANITGSNTICSGDVLILSSTVTNGGPTPSFVWKRNGTTMVGETNDSLMALIVNDQDVFSSVVTASGCGSGSATSNLLTITVTPGNLVNVFATTYSDSVCVGVPVTFTATPTNGGTTPVYQWQRNGVNVGTNSTVYTPSSLTNNDVITVQMTSNSSAVCLRNNPATSTPLTMKVVSSMTSSVQITSTATTICSGLSVTFTATPGRNAGLSPSYQWKVNGANVGSNSTTFSSTTLANNDQVTCVMTPSITCATPSTSNIITISVTTTVAPSVTISTPSSSVCAGSTATFTAVPTNGGSSPSYQWQINGAIQSAVLSTFTPASITNNDVIKAILTSNLACASTPTATSNTITMTVNPLVTPSVSIAATATTICPGTSVTFTATPVNGGAAPTYVWKENGIPTGTSGTTYTVANLVNNDVVTVEMNHNHACGSATPNPVVSNPITITVTPNVSASVNITSSPTTPCPATATTFTAVPAGGGSTPAYQWKLNGGNVGGNSTTYANSTLAAGDVVTVVMTSNAACVIGSPATSNSKTVSPATTATMSISASANPICSGTSVTFTSVIAGGGTTPTYIWKKNLTTIPGETNPTLVISSLANGDQITGVMTSNAACAIGSPVTSNTITMTVTAIPAISVSITPTSPSICGGNSVLFTATPVNAGASPSYQWQINSQNVGLNQATFSSSTLGNNDAVRVIMTSSAACAGSTATSNVATVTVSNPPTAANAGFDQFVTTATATLAATPPASGTGAWSTAGSATITPPLSNAGASVSNLAVGANTFTWTVTSGTCPPSTDNVVINRGSKPTVKTIVGPINVTVSSTGITYTLSAAAQPGSSYTWTVSGATLASGQGTNSITVNFGSTAGAVDIFVTEFNNYGDYTATLRVNVGTPPPQKTITGDDYVVINTTGVPYSILNPDAGSTFAWTVTAGATLVTNTSSNVTLNAGSSATTVTLTVVETNIYGSMTANKTITIGTLPPTPVIIGPDSVVTGSTVSYTIATHPGSTYSWSNVPNVTIATPTSNTTNITFTASGSVTLVVTETNAAGPATGTKVGIKVGTVATVSGITILQNGLQYTFTAVTDAGGHSNFYWTIPAGATIVSGAGTATITVDFPAGTTTGIVAVTQDNGFGTSSTSIPITVTGLGHAQSNSISYTMFPNPFSDAVDLTFNTPVSNDLSITIMTPEGKIVYHGNGYRTNERIVLGRELPVGLYILKAISEEKVQVIKMNKQ
jgi:PKD repeat protein